MSQTPGIGSGVEQGPSFGRGLLIPCQQLAGAGEVLGDARRAMLHRFGQTAVTAGQGAQGFKVLSIE
ncbi:MULTISPECIES: hypothetical protein [unclassified Streptomyces]|uniref:hypothetical protein n=1 Tax=unclassified Streptomyces TaxID=2593676 RepID=UPI000C0787C6|nr:MULTISPECIES: hypothetical protein [unclassified Streptomyces]MYU02066.1 hypothetical protein [Streptomyces sp. SID8350]